MKNCNVDPDIELHKHTIGLLAETQAKILIEIHDKWSYDQIVYAALKSLSRELKLEE